MQRKMALIAGIVLMGFAAQAQKINVQYDKKTDFSKYKTYTWMPHDAAARPILALDVYGAIDNQLKAKGLQKVDKGGDLVVNGYGSLDEGMNVSYDHDIYAAPGLDSPITWANGTPRPGNGVSIYVDKGTLVVDIADRQTKGLIWRGIAKAKVDPEQVEKTFEIAEKAVAKMFKEYPSPK
jgi:hypothetical protein